MIGAAPCADGERCVNTPGSFVCRHELEEREGDGGEEGEDGDGGRQSDVAVNGAGLNGQRGRGPTTTSTTTTSTSTRGRGISRLHCGTGFHFNRHSGRCEGTTGERERERERERSLFTMSEHNKYKLDNGRLPERNNHHIRPPMIIEKNNH